MKKFLEWLLVACFSWPVWAQGPAAGLPVDLGGLRKGTINEGCYHDPCSVGKLLEVKKVTRIGEELKVDLMLLGATRDRDSKKYEWNDAPHEVIVTCSIRNPRTGFPGEEEETIPLNEDMIPGTLWNDTEFYLWVCHNGRAAMKRDEDIEAFAQRLGYTLGKKATED